MYIKGANAWTFRKGVDEAEESMNIVIIGGINNCGWMDDDDDANNNNNSD